MVSMIKSIVFDMDGVLIDARDWHYDALNRALRLFGMEIGRAEHLATFDGLPTMRKLQLLTLEKGLPTGLHGFVNDMKQRYTTEIVITRCKPTFAHQYALAKLRSEGYRLAVASNSVRSSVELMMEKSSLLEYLDFYLSNQDVARAKPDPEIYTTAMERLGIQPDQCLVVEDNENGVRAAIASGAHVMRVNGVHDVHYDSIRERIRQVEENRP